MHLPFELDRPLVFFDLETTGLDLKKDRIIELAFIKWTPHGDVLERERRFNPGIPIPPEATAVHGITDADVADEVEFCRTARSLADMLEGCDLAGFNVRRFDIPMLVQEFARCGVDLSLEGQARGRHAEHLPPGRAPRPLRSGPLLPGPRARRGPYGPGRHTHVRWCPRRSARALSHTCLVIWTDCTPIARSTHPRAPSWTDGSAPRRRGVSFGGGSTGERHLPKSRREAPDYLRLDDRAGRHGRECPRGRPWRTGHAEPAAGTESDGDHPDGLADANER